jgi:hypothetical protein
MRPAHDQHITRAEVARYARARRRRSALHWTLIAALCVLAFGLAVSAQETEWRDGWKPVDRRQPAGVVYVVPNVPPLPRIVVPWKILNR